MTKEEEIPDWVGAQEFHDHYEPKEILGRYAYGDFTRDVGGIEHTSLLYCWEFDEW